MPEKYHIPTKPVPPRLPRIGKHGIVDWREDCARCHNCVKKACVYDRYRQEAEYLRNLKHLDHLFFDCMGCFSCVQDCTKGLLSLTINSEFEQLGNAYWVPDIILSTWLQAETGKVPVSGAGYRGRFSGHGFDSMWTDMSEIVRPTRDGIHGREYISTSVDLGRRPSVLCFEEQGLVTRQPALVSLPLPLILDKQPAAYSLPRLEPALVETAARTGLIAIIDAATWPFEGADEDRHLPHVAFLLRPDSPEVPGHLLKKTRLVEVADHAGVRSRIRQLKDAHPDLVVSVRVDLDAHGAARAVALAEEEETEVIHVVADLNGSEIGARHPRFIKDMIRQIHTTLIESGKRDEVTIMAGGGIALAEHMAKAIICGADLVTASLPFMIALECHLCSSCETGVACPAKLEKIDFDYSTGRMINLVSAWHLQLIEVMGAMGMREARRLRGDVGRAMFFEELEEQIFGKLFGKRI